MRIDKSVFKVTVWHHEAMPSDAKQWPEGQICLSVPHIYVGFFFLHIGFHPLHIKSVLLSLTIRHFEN